MQTHQVSLKDNGDGLAISTLYLSWKGTCCWIATSLFSLKGYGGDEIPLFFEFLCMYWHSFYASQSGSGMAIAWQLLLSF